MVLICPLPACNLLYEILKKIEQINLSFDVTQTTMLIKANFFNDIFGGVISPDPLT